MSPVAYRDVAKAFGSVLKTARTGAGYTQEKLAELADIDRTYPSLLERGKREPGLGVVIRLGEALRVYPILLVRMTLLRLKRGERD
jgi:transcriptional regulator with XRE-family HTH domain